MVTLLRADRPGWWPSGYWDGLVGCGLRIPALVESGKVLAGLLVAVEESSEKITLTFEGLQPE